jgi:hypothetical protein
VTLVLTLRRIPGVPAASFAVIQSFCAPPTNTTMAETNAQRSQRRAHEGQSLETHVPRDTFASDPSRGGSAGYPLWYRLVCIQKVTQVGLAQVVQEHPPCRRTLQNWMDRIHPYKQKRGQPKQLIGRDQLLLAIYMTAYPDTKIEEFAAYILNGGGLHSTSTISRRMQELRLTRKRASIEAFQVFLPRNILKRDQFFGLLPPLGVNGIERRRLIDVDECLISIEQTNRRSGRAHTTIQVQKPGHYVKGKKLTVIFFLEPGDPTLQANQDGSIQNPRRWFYAFEDGGTTSEIFSAKVDLVLQLLEASNWLVDQRRILLWDYLRSHLTIKSTKRSMLGRRRTGSNLLLGLRTCPSTVHPSMLLLNWDTCFDSAARTIGPTLRWGKRSTRFSARRLDKEGVSMLSFNTVVTAPRDNLYSSYFNLFSSFFFRLLLRTKAFIALSSSNGTEARVNPKLARCRGCDGSLVERLQHVINEQKVFVI